MNFLRLFVIAITSYCLGAANGSIIVSRLLYNKDIRKLGSGNAGMTNMLRVFGPIGAGLTVLVDVMKSLVAILIAGWLFGFAGYPLVGKLFSGFCLMLGHIFPIFFGFRGGKGILCGAVMIFLVDWRIGLILIAVFGVLVAATRYVSLGSIAAAALLPLMVLLFKYGVLCTVLSLLCALLTIFKHRDNIGRLVTGKESKLSFSGNTGRKTNEK